MFADRYLGALGGSWGLSQWLTVGINGLTIRLIRVINLLVKSPSPGTGEQTAAQITRFQGAGVV